jgi:aerobic-type carbon monoxide dehydrogenase small subunit (CoxS/CutS family)
MSDRRSKRLHRRRHEFLKAVLEAFAFQRGYCTPGFLMEAVVMVDRLKRAPVRLAKLDAEIEQACGTTCAAPLVTR